MDIDDDDEFGDLYSDVLRPLSIPSNPPSPSDPLPIPAAAPIPSQNPNPVDALAPAVKESKKDEWNWEDDEDEDADGANFKAELEPRVLEVARVSGSVENKAKVGAADGISVSKTEIGGDLEQEPVIPGLYTAPAPTSNVGDDWDSDSDDDLQIVLNDSTHGPMGGRGEYDDDEDLVIVADEGHGQGMVRRQMGGLLPVELRGLGIVVMGSIHNIIRCSSMYGLVLQQLVLLDLQVKSGLHKWVLMLVGGEVTGDLQEEAFQVPQKVFIQVMGLVGPIRPVVLVVDWISPFPHTRRYLMSILKVLRKNRGDIQKLIFRIISILDWMRTTGKNISNSWTIFVWNLPCKAKSVCMRVGEQSRTTIQIYLLNL